MENKQMTAVEWLEEKMIASGFLIPKSFVEQAKQMEKDQNYSAYASGKLDPHFMVQPSYRKFYEETYGTQLDS